MDTCSTVFYMEKADIFQCHHTQARCVTLDCSISCLIGTNNSFVHCVCFSGGRRVDCQAFTKLPRLGGSGECDERCSYC
jgi:hypothetical protein